MLQHVPSDIQKEISKWLPLKSLLRFRSVSKAWKSLINCPKFIADYTVCHAQSQQHILIRYEVGDWDETEVKYVSIVDDDTFPQQKSVPTVPSLVEILDDDGSREIGSSNDFVCFFDHYFEGKKEDVAVLWNPSINKSIVVLVPNVLISSCSSVVSFGVCPHTGDPKLVKITCYNPLSEPDRTCYMTWHVMVFSVTSKRWELPCGNLPRKSIGFTWSQAAIGQFIYFLAYDRWNSLIISFDMSIEEFRDMKLPYCLARMFHTSLSISRLRDSLALIQTTTEFRDLNWKQVFNVWRMEHGDPKSFTKLYTIKPPRDASIMTTLGFRESGEPIIDMISYRHFSQKVVVYEPFLEHFHDLEISINRCQTFVNSYSDSLLLLDEEDEYIYFPLDD